MKKLVKQPLSDNDELYFKKIHEACLKILSDYRIALYDNNEEISECYDSEGLYYRYLVRLNEPLDKITELNWLFAKWYAYNSSSLPDTGSHITFRFLKG
ncbi:MAG: hypothetical protein CMF49_05055 [Legionellales bacterium]|nr:hypothetical protein [Legionellales bacterium]|tara:strand:+ start:292 stop:588 length:297 start_codon:yes stop_codon:yes gene_type:complete